MFYEISLYIVLAVFGAGLIYKISTWFRYSIDMPDTMIPQPVSPRFKTAAKGVLQVLFSPKIFTLIQVFFKDVLAQVHILNADSLRWLMHMLIFAGFMFLLITHAFDKLIFTSLYDRYYLTLNPFLLLAGLMVLSGIGIALYRRFVLKVPRLKTAGADTYLLAILAVIMLSGIAMELTKLTSYNNYQSFWYIHITACFFGLAYLPFSKLFHAFSTPVSLLANAVMDKDSNSANIRTRQMMELDACTRCSTCSDKCSVAAAFDSIGNPVILPSERMKALKDYFANKNIGKDGLTAIQQGIYLCTNCDRCTVACPAGINLKDLWFDVREEMIQRGDSLALVLSNFSYYRGLNSQKINTEAFNIPLEKAQNELSGQYELIKNTDEPIALTPDNQAFKETSGLSEKAATFMNCFACENCSTVCPVVGNYENPQEALDLLPHQIMRSMAFGIKDLAMGSRMLWNCLTCYQCQEHCPQGVKVTDILFELKNISAKEADCS